jgi:hypothetical protein
VIRVSEIEFGASGLLDIRVTMLAAVVTAENYPALVALSAPMENESQFKKFPPIGPGV